MLPSGFNELDNFLLGLSRLICLTPMVSLSMLSTESHSFVFFLLPDKAGLPLLCIPLHDAALDPGPRTPPRRPGAAAWQARTGSLSVRRLVWHRPPCPGSWAWVPFVGQDKNVQALTCSNPPSLSFAPNPLPNFPFRLNSSPAPAPPTLPSPPPPNTHTHRPLFQTGVEPKAQGRDRHAQGA